MPCPRVADSRFGAENVSVRASSYHQQAVVRADAAGAFAPIQRIGGSRGWYFANWLWAWRGAVDLLAGGVGMRRGRRHPVDVRAGDPLDFWRVEAFEPNRLLRLQAEMKVPGRAWLQFEVEAAEGGKPHHPDGGVRPPRSGRTAVTGTACTPSTG